MNLRPYQTRAVTECRALLAAKAARVVLVAPTGSGKTVMAQAIAEGEDALWLVPSLALREQSPGRSVTVQALLGGRRPPCSLLIADECHHLAGSAEQWAAVAASYPRVLGLTATPCRADGAAIGEQFHHLVVAAQYGELVDLKYLTPCRVVRPVDTPEEESGLAMQPVDAWHRYAGWRQTFAFFSRVELARRFAAAVEGEVVWGEQDPDERLQIMQRFKSGETSVLASVATLTEGVDVPAAAVCLLAVMPAHEGSYLQRVGRVLRPSPGKTEALLIDLPGACHRFGFPTDDREYSLTGEPIRRSEGTLALSQCLKCGAVYRAAPVCPVCGWIRPAKVRPPRIWGVAMEIVDPQNLSPAARGKLTWKQRVKEDNCELLNWLVKKSVKSSKHAFVLCKQVVGVTMPESWWGINW